MIIIADLPAHGGIVENYFVIKGRLPGLNEVIGKNRASKWGGSQIKHATDTAIAWQIKTQIGMGRCRKPSGPVRIRIEWHEATRRRDLDNIFSAKKFILDAMQRMGILEGDGQKYVVGLSDEFYLDDESREMAEFLKNNKDYRVLFDAMRNVRPSDIQKVKDFIDEQNGNT